MKIKNVHKSTYYSAIAVTVFSLFILSGCKDDTPSPVNNQKPVNAQIIVTAMPTENIKMDENPDNGDILATMSGFSTLGEVELKLASQSPSGAFAFDPQSRRLTVANESLFDYEKHKTLTCTIEGYVGQEWNKEEITVTLNDLEELPTIQALLDGGKMPWEIISDNPKYKDSSFLAKKFQGGVIYYFDVDQSRVWIVATDNIGTATWGCKGTQTSKHGWSIFGAKEGSETIAAECGEAGIAVKKCLDLTLNGYSDWYLPSDDDLNIVASGVLGDQYTKLLNWNVGDKFWTSTQENADQGMYLHVDFKGFGKKVAADKDEIHLVRPVRRVYK